MSIRLESRRPGASLSGAMTDISFLLIVFFLVSAAFVAEIGITMLLPDPDQPPSELTPDEVVQVTLQGDGSLVVDGEILDLRGASSRIAERAAKLTEPIAILTLGRGVSYQSALDLLSLCRSAGITGYSLVSEAGDPVPVDLGEDE